jgi:small GTP-binding protein
MTKYTHIVKCIIVGNSRVGKSSIVRHYTERFFPHLHDTTIGVEFGAQIITLSKLDTVNIPIIKLQIWDTAGQEVFKSITRSYYRDASIVFIVFDLSSFDALDNLEDWVKDTVEYCKKEYKCIVFIGNKKDLPRKCPCKEDIQKLLNKFNLTSPSGQNHKYQYHEISAKNRDELCNLFEDSLYELFKTYPECIEETKLKNYPLNITRKGYLRFDDTPTKKRCNC